MAVFSLTVVMAERRKGQPTKTLTGLGPPRGDTSQEWPLSSIIKY